MKQHQAFPGRFLKAADVADQKYLTLTIKKVTSETVGDDPAKLVVHFRYEDRGLVLNKTNFSAIAEFTGEDDTDNWSGWAITLGVVKVPYQGQRVPALRVSGATRASELSDAPLTDEDIPF